MREVSYIIWEKSNASMLTIWGADWNSFGVADYTVITLDLSSCWIHKTSIITIQQSARYLVFYNRDTSIQLGLL